jgi:Protein of unknown function (DUF4007)
MSKKEKLSFTGHDTFHCRNFWLKKGYDFIKSGGKFNDEAVIELGVGRNMVSAVRYWLRCFGITDEDDTTLEIADTLFDTEGGLDPYCEDKGTVYLLHYLLVTTRRASIYSLVFNQFRKERIEFSKEQLVEYLVNYCRLEDFTVQRSSLERDVDTFLHNYFHKPSLKNSITEEMSGILQELNLVEFVSRKEGKDTFKIESKERPDLPPSIVLFAIVRQLKNGLSISFQELLNGSDSVGSVFALNANGLMQKIEELLEIYPQDLVFTDDGGIRLLQFKKQFSELDILNNSYHYASESLAFG